MSERGLTPREKEIVTLLSKGKDYKEVAYLLDISFETVHSHLKNVRLKLDAVNTMQAITISITRGFIVI
jgi:DNA-binding CsgD family transcriptional regulator